MDINSLSPAQQRVLLDQLAQGDLRAATGQMGLEAVGMLGEGTRAYGRATDGFVRGGQKALMGISPNSTGAVARMAVNPAFRGALRALPAIGAIGGVMGAADVLAGDDSAGNKIMDGTAMTIGGILGAAGGPLGIAAGAGAGKMVSDGAQWLFGDKKSAEQRRMEEALKQLRGIG